nr:piRNA biogenesis protein EXD1-like [Parasteatoda tepidariorum]
MNIINSLLALENYRIKFLTGEGDYEGTISRIVPEIQLIVITNAVWLPKYRKLGTLTFRAKEIISFDVIGRSESSNISESLTNNYRGFYERNDLRPTIFDDESDETSSINESELCSELDSEERVYTFDLPPSLCKILPLDNVVINEFDENFDYCIQHFRQQDVIGISLESPKIRRNETLHWLCIATSCCTFLIDIFTLGEYAFTKGIKDILEDPKIEKVVHDSREVSDCLFHCYNTKLVNVFDTQVADYIINRQKTEDGKIIPYVQPLNSCLSHYLNVPEEFLFRRKKRCYQDDLVFYELRPLREDLRNLFTKNVIYLRLLKQELDILLLEPLDKCVDIYMKSKRCKTDSELKLERFVHNVVPDELLFEEIKLFRFEDHVDIPATVSSGPPFREFQDSFKDYCKINKKEISIKIDK